MSVTVAICDYGVGNLRSVERALLAGGARVAVSSDPEVVAATDGAVLPGVGAFGPAAEKFLGSGLAEAVTDLVSRDRPVLGICVGFQLMFESSEEGEGGRGLGLFPGRIRRLAAPGLKIPQIGWNRLHRRRSSPLVDGVDEGAWVYFVHSYAPETEPEQIVATTDYGGEVVAACARGAVMGTQFHPEKSGATGLRIYANFVAGCAGVAAPVAMSRPRARE